MSPGRYKVRLTVDGEYSEQPLRVTMDPRVTVLSDTLAAQLDFQRTVIEAMNSSFVALMEVRGFRAGLEKRREKAGAAGAAVDAIAEADREARAIETGEAPGGRRTAGSGLTGVNATLAAIINALDLSDSAPTAVQREGYTGAKAKLNELLAGWKRLSELGLARVNAALRAAGIPEITPGELEHGGG